jgi:hypothetical protein
VTQLWVGLGVLLLTWAWLGGRWVLGHRGAGPTAPTAPTEPSATAGPDGDDETFGSAATGPAAWSYGRDWVELAGEGGVEDEDDVIDLGDFEVFDGREDAWS